MFDVSWLIFVGASLVVILAPGQDMILVMSRGMSQGAAAGIAAGAGVSLGLLCHTLLAALGLGALLAASEMAFTILKIVGAAYLLYLGVRLLWTGHRQMQAQAAKQSSLFKTFSTGALSNLSNPKIALFYFAFLPQFVPAGAAHPTLILFALGVVFAALTFLIKVPVGYFAGGLSAWFRAHPQALTWLYRISGMALIGIGLRLALSERA
ncbi:MAG: LysE family translocator [Pseudomonadota bacterium]